MHIAVHARSMIPAGAGVTTAAAAAAAAAGHMQSCTYTGLVNIGTMCILYKIIYVEIYRHHFRNKVYSIPRCYLYIILTKPY